jgi:hypothetical protein
MSIVERARKLRAGGHLFEHRPATASSQFIERFVRSHAIDPGGKSASPIEAAETTSDGDHCLLGGVEGVLVVAQKPTADRVAAVVMTPEQRLECCAITALRGREDLTLVGC